MLKTVAAGLMSLACLSASAKELTSYQQVVDAISHQGKGVRVVFNVKNSKSDYPLDIDAVGSLVPDALMAIEGKYVTFASLHFTTHEPQYNGRTIYESTKYNLTPDNVLSMTTEILDAKSFQALGNSSSTSCVLGEGVQFYTVS